MIPAQTLAHDAIEALIPHSGTMCLLARLDEWDSQHIVCAADNHRDPRHPLRTRTGLLSPVVIEYAAQAMALHGALAGLAAGTAATPGYLTSARNVELRVLRLDDLPAVDDTDANANDATTSTRSVVGSHRDELRIEAIRQAGDAQQILYTFNVSHAGRLIAQGRAAVVLNTALEVRT